MNFLKFFTLSVWYPENFFAAFALGVGGGSKSSTQSTSSTTNQVVDTRVAATEGSVAFGSNSQGNTVQSVDADVIKASGDVIERIAENTNETSSRNIEAITKAAADLSYESGETSREAIRSAESTSYESGKRMAETSREALQSNEGVSRAAITGIESAAYEAGKVAENSSKNALNFGEHLATDAFSVAKDALGKTESIAYEGQVTARETSREALGFGESVLGKVLDSFEKNDESTKRLIQDTNSQFVGNLARNAGDAPQTVFQDAQKLVLYLGVGALALGALYVFTKKAA